MEGDDSEDSPSAKKLSLSTDKREVDVLQEVSKTLELYTSVMRIHMVLEETCPVHG